MNDTENLTDTQIHYLSLSLGSMYAEAYKEDPLGERTDNIFEAYKSMRRALPKDLSTGKREGSYAAFLSTQGQFR